MIGTTSGGDGSIWVFGYGSLMWRPDFAYVEAAPALLRGYHRAFCIYSVHYRGTRARPGLILGLDRGGSCRGRAFRVAAPDAAGVIDYLDSRELVTNVYIRRNLPIVVGGARILALAYVADPTHAQYAGTLPPEQAARVILGGRGISGDNPDYLRNVVAHLDDLGISDGPSHRLLRLVEEANG